MLGIIIMHRMIASVVRIDMAIVINVSIDVTRHMVTLASVCVIMVLGIVISARLALCGPSPYKYHSDGA